MSAYLRFGVLSPLWLERQVAGRGGTGADGYQAELAWRDFYGAVQLHFPETARREFQERYRSLEWDHDPQQLTAWKEGRTGFPVVDAAMRELLACGWMHNRARMIVGSFLTKDLGEDWRAGEAHFMEHRSTATWAPTTAAGSGSPPRAPTRRRTSSACSTR